VEPMGYFIYHVACVRPVPPREPRAFLDVGRLVELLCRGTIRRATVGETDGPNQFTAAFHPVSVVLDRRTFRPTPSSHPGTRIRFVSTSDKARRPRLYSRETSRT